ncbi:helicase-associated domain-containing protein [Bacillus sp. CMF21]|nr:helicase-associated domain-containing protein [Bacillus sp. CMF21]
MYKYPIITHEKSRLLYVCEWQDPKGKIKDQMIKFADLIKTPEEVSTFLMSPYSLWTAAAKGISAEEIIEFLEKKSQNKLSEGFINTVKKNIREFGSLSFVTEDGYLVLKAKNHYIISEIKRINTIESKIVAEPNETSLIFNHRDRLEIKKILFNQSLFIKDSTNYRGNTLNFRLLKKDSYGEPIVLQDFQSQAAESFLEYNRHAGGGGTIIMPPSSGKTLVALKIMESLETTTLIITENESSLKRWMSEISDKTDYPKDLVGSICSSHIDMKPITVSTYRDVYNNLNHLKEFGLIIYDDAHKLPTENNEKTVLIQSTYKLALASTLARSDGQGMNVIGLIGPKWYEILPNKLVESGFHVPVNCVEIKIPLPQLELEEYERASNNPEHQRNIAANNSLKRVVTDYFLKTRPTNQTLIISFFVEIAKKYGDWFDLEVITGEDSLENEEIDALLVAFNNKRITKMIASSLKVERKQFNELDTIIALTYQKGSEREEYLRVGKLMPQHSKTESYLISLVTRNSIEERDYFRRKRKLSNYGFRYKIEHYESILAEGNNS